MTSWTAADLPSFAGRTVIVTGANSGIGEIAAAELASNGATVIIAVRTIAKGDAAAERMSGDVEVRRLDLADLSSVREFADGVEKVDVLINNAGVMGVPLTRTADGFEMQIGTNHLGHFALTNLLLPKITDRVVTVSSELHTMGRIDLADLNYKTRKYSAWGAYGQSKLANLLFTTELQARLDQVGSRVKAYAAHPGYSSTNLQGNSGRKLEDALMKAGNVFATSAAFGARQTLYAASAELPGDTFVGPRFKMWGPTGPASRSKRAQDKKTGRELWALSEQLTDTKFPL